MIPEKPKNKVLYSFTCECVFQRNGMEVTLNNKSTKSKTFKLLSCQPDDQPYSDLNFELAILVGNSEEVLHKFKLDKLRKMHSNFIKEGRMSLEVVEDITLPTPKSMPSDIMLKASIKNEKLLLIMIKNTSMEILQNFCRMMTDIKIKAQNNANGTKSTSSENKGNSNSVPQLQSQKSNPSPVPTLVRQNSQTNNFKVNRTALNNIMVEENKQKEDNLKRKFDKFKADALAPVESTYQQKRLKVNSPNPFKILPDAVIIHIMRFLTQRERTSMRLVSKTFHDVMANARVLLDLRGKGDVPPEIVIKYLNSCKNLSELHVGQSKFLSSTHFLQGIKVSFYHLKFIDFAEFQNLSDKCIQKFFMECKTLETLKLGYYSHISDNSILSLSKYDIKLKGFYLKCGNKLNHEKRDKVTDTALSKMIHEQTLLQNLSLYLTGAIFFQKTFDIEYPKLTTLKLEYVKFFKHEELPLLINITKCPNLEYLKIGTIVIDRMNILLKDSDSETFREIFSKLKKLRTIKLGAFTNNHVLMHISNCNDELEKIVLGSEDIDDDGMSMIVRMAHKLVHIDISHCLKIGGHFLEDITSRKLRRLIINFDEHRCKCVEQILQEKGLRGQTVLINRTTKKYY